MKNERKTQSKTKPNNDIELRLKELEKRLYDHIDQHIEDEVPVMDHEEFVEYSEWKRQRRHHEINRMVK